MISLQTVALHAALLFSLTGLQTSRSVAGLVPIFTPHSSKISVGSIWNKAPKPFRLRATKDDEDLTNPENWFADTDAQTLIEAIGKEGTSKAEIRKALDDSAIVSLADLLEKSEVVFPGLIDPKYRKSFVVNLAPASQRIRNTVEEALGGEAHYEESCLPKECYNMFAIGAVSVEPSATRAREKGVRQVPFTLVLGPSGSGKTIFALKQLPNLLFSDDDNVVSKAHFSVQFRTEFVVREMESSGQTFPEAVAAFVQRKIKEEMLLKNLIDSTVVDLHLHVIVDEAGGEEYQDFFNEEAKILSLVDAIALSKPYKFLKGVHVTVVGTGLEATTELIPSTVEAFKFRMRPWTLENFKALAEKSPRTSPKLIMETIEAYPILEDLITNGRCSYFVLMALQNDLNLRKSRANDFVKGIVRSVADNYIASNGLSRLKDPNDKFEVVRSVFRELDKSTGQPGKPFFPRFADIRVGLRSVAFSLVDINVESSLNETRFVRDDSDFTLSVSPALAIVLANLVNEDSQITWDWDGFESIVMLSEMKRMIVQTNYIPSRLDNFIFKAESPIPGTRALSTFSVPVVGNCTVILNGRIAGYADVIAPYRLSQCKFSAYDSSIKDLEIQAELDKMGLTSSSRFKQFLTDVFYSQIWSSKVDAPSPAVDTKVMSTKRSYRHECYPFDILNSRRIVEERAVLRGKFFETVGLWLTENGKRSLFSAPITFDKERPVTAVFATNCNAFRLKESKEAKVASGKAVKPKTVPSGKSDEVTAGKTVEFDDDDAVEKDAIEMQATDGVTKTKSADDVKATKPVYAIISPSDVDCHGKLHDPNKIPVELIAGLRENVDIRFLFFGRH